MLAWFLFALLILVSAAFGLVFWLQQKQIASLREARNKIQIEEDRVFEFLRGLGEAFSEHTRLGDLNRLIVEGACRILDAHGGAIYLVSPDKSSPDKSVLVPRFVSKSCPPMVDVPPHILQQMDTTPQALSSYLQLHPVERGEGLLGQVWEDGMPALVSGGDPRLTGLRDTTLKTEGAMICPLVYAQQTLGVLVLANGPLSKPFSKGDFSVFRAIAEQSAFALYSAIVYSQANEKKRLDRDLEIAQDVQRILLPTLPPKMETFEVSGVNVPAQHVSGDYFGYIPVDDHRWGIAIADVSGKGVPASLIMATCRSVLRSSAPGHQSASEVLRQVNRLLYPDIKEDMFISMAYVILDDKSDTITFCRAGHDAPILYSASTGTLTRLNPPGMALGIDSGDVFDRITGDFSQKMESGDCLVLYTDGVTEALDRKGLEFGMDNMMLSIQEGAKGGAQKVIERLTDDLHNFTQEIPQNDDITLIVIRKK